MAMTPYERDLKRNPVLPNSAELETLMQHHRVTEIAEHICTGVAKVFSKYDEVYEHFEGLTEQQVGESGAEDEEAIRGSMDEAILQEMTELIETNVIQPIQQAAAKVLHFTPSTRSLFEKVDILLSQLLGGGNVQDLQSIVVTEVKSILGIKELVLNIPAGSGAATPEMLQLMVAGALQSMGIRLPVAGESVEPGRQIRDVDVVVVSPPSTQEPEAPLEAQPETTPSAIDTIKPYLKRGAKIDEKGRATLRKYILGREDFPELMAVYVRLKEKKYEGSLTTCKEDFSARTVQGTTTVWTLFMKLNTQEVAYMKSLELYRILKFVFEGTDVPVIQDEKKDGADTLGAVTGVETEGTLPAQAEEEDDTDEAKDPDYDQISELPDDRYLQELYDRWLTDDDTHGEGMSEKLLALRLDDRHWLREKLTKKEGEESYAQALMRYLGTSSSAPETSIPVVTNAGDSEAEPKTHTEEPAPDTGEAIHIELIADENHPKNIARKTFREHPEYTSKLLPIYARFVANEKKGAIRFFNELKGFRLEGYEKKSLATLIQQCASDRTRPISAPEIVDILDYIFTDAGDLAESAAPTPEDDSGSHSAGGDQGVGTEDATVVTSSQPDGASDEKKVVDGDTEVLLAEPLITADSYTMQSFHSIEGFDNADDYIRKFGQWILTQDIQANTTTHVFVAIQKAEKAGFQGLKDRIKTYKKDAAQTHEGKEMTGWVLGLYLCYLDLPAPKDEEEVPHDGGEKTFVEEEPTDAPKLTEETFLEVVEYIKSRQPYIDALRSVWSQHLTKSPRDVRISLDRLAHTLSDYIDGLVTIFGASSRLEIVADILELPWTPEHQEKHMRKRNPFDELKPHEAKLREVHGLLSRESGTDGNSDFERIFDGAQVEWPRSQNWKFREDCEYVGTDLFSLIKRMATNPHEWGLEELGIHASKRGSAYKDAQKAKMKKVIEWMAKESGWDLK